MWSQRLIFVKRDPHLVEDDASSTAAPGEGAKETIDLAAISSTLAEVSMELKSLREVVNSLRGTDKN